LLDSGTAPGFDPSHFEAHALIWFATIADVIPESCKNACQPFDDDRILGNKNAFVDQRWDALPIESIAE